jgi:two-component system sensor histidine kinase YesM
LNNTLEIINWEVRLGNNERVSKMIEALSTMLDAAMSRRASTLVTLEEELAYVDAYLYIVSERFGKRLSVRKSIDESLLGCRVPRLITQPIIENAVEHGADKQQTGAVEIFAKDNGDCTMTISVCNNSPLSEDDEAVVAKILGPDYDPKETGSTHLGIYNVNQRLKMIYGDSCGLVIASDGKNTAASFTAPMLTSEVDA